MILGMTPAMVRTLGLVTVLAACAAEPRKAEPKPEPPSEPEVIAQISATGQAARDLIETIAARCWLDGIARGAAMVVDRRTGRVIIVSDTDDLLYADFLTSTDGRSRVRLTGPLVADPATARRLAQTIDTAEKTGETACPIAEG